MVGGQPLLGVNPPQAHGQVGGESASGCRCRKTEVMPHQRDGRAHGGNVPLEGCRPCRDIKQTDGREALKVSLKGSGVPYERVDIRRGSGRPLTVREGRVEILSGRDRRLRICLGLSVRRAGRPCPSFGAECGKGSVGRCHIRWVGRARRCRRDCGPGTHLRGTGRGRSGSRLTGATRRTRGQCHPLQRGQDDRRHT